jgi:hypothetical protein
VTIEISLARLKRWLVSAALWLALGAVGFEISGVLFFYWTNGGLVYLNTRGSGAAEAAGPPRYRQRPHPYFGFTGLYDQDYGSIRTNNLGFLQRERISVPLAAEPNDLIVAVFGGSVAESLATNLTGGPSLRDSLQALPALAHRRIVILNMAQGAGKQPQQLIELVYLLALGQRIDVVINVDGFNEFALGYQNYAADLDPILPAIQRMKPLAMEMYRGQASADYYEIASRMLSARNAMERYSQSMRQASTGMGVTYAGMLARWHRMMFERYTDRYAEFFIVPNDWRDLRTEMGLDLSPQTSGAGTFKSIFDVWLRCSQQMKLLAAVNHATYLHVVQPNAFYTKPPVARREGPATLTYYYNIGINGGYSLMAERGETLRSNGIASAVDLFDGQPDGVYVDNCCHFTPRAEGELVRFIVAELERQLAVKAQLPGDR